MKCFFLLDRDAALSYHAFEREKIVVLNLTLVIADAHNRFAEAP